MLEVAFVISVCQIVRLCLLPDTHKEWLRVRDGPSYIHLCLYGLPMEAPCLAERPRHLNFFLGPARHVMDFARHACAGCAAVGNTSSTHVSQSC